LRSQGFSRLAFPENVPGTIVTMMSPRHVRDVLIAGSVVYWKGTLVEWDVDRVLRQAEQARDRVRARINGPAKTGTLPPSNNSLSNPYRPHFLGDCCHKGTNTTAQEYVLKAIVRREPDHR
jgi:5-methylthioadenosine/S-adenosylhomocysteine deaminase